MQQAEQAGTGNRRRTEARGETLAALRGGESFSELAHDARNMVTALALYCELLEEPGVLNPAALHLAQELRLVTAASWRLLEKLARVERRGPANFAGTPAWRSSPLVEALPGTRPAGAQGIAEAQPPCSPGIEDLAEEVESNRNLLAALAGPGVTVRVRTTGGACPVRLNGEDLTRVLVNLVRNSTEGMHGSGSIRIGLSECVEASELRLRLTVVDSGPGIPDADLERVFEKGFSTSSSPNRNGAKHGKPSSRRGLGLSIARNLVEAAGGRIVAGNCAAGGARIAIELPVRAA
jgi:signal transduction histidine kinase